jgi:hypothetical protein
MREHEKSRKSNNCRKEKTHYKGYEALGGEFPKIDSEDRYTFSGRECKYFDLYFDKGQLGIRI